MLLLLTTVAEDQIDVLEAKAAERGPHSFVEMLPREADRVDGVFVTATTAVLPEAQYTIMTELSGCTFAEVSVAGPG